MLGAIPDTQPGNIVWRALHGFFAVDHDGAGTAADHVHDGFQCGTAPGAIAPQQGDQLTALHHHVNAVQNVRFPVESVQARNAQLSVFATLIRAHGATSSAGSVRDSAPRSPLPSLPIYTSRTRGSAETVW